MVGSRNAFILVSFRLSPVPVFPLSPVPRFLGFAFSPAMSPFRVCTVLSVWPTRPGTGPRGPRYSVPFVVL